MNKERKQAFKLRRCQYCKKKFFMQDKKHVCIDCRLKKHMEQYDLNKQGKLQIKTYINNKDQ